MSERVEEKFGINDLCKQCENYKKDCKGMETQPYVNILACGNGNKYKKNKTK